VHVRNEPVRTAALAGGLTTAGLSLVAMRSRGASWRYVAAVALAQWGLAVAAGEYARRLVYGPVTARDVEARGNELEQALMLAEARRDA
jgi:hypothetical protein